MTPERLAEIEILYANGMCGPRKWRRAIRELLDEVELLKGLVAQKQMDRDHWANECRKLHDFMDGIAT